MIAIQVVARALRPGWGGGESDKDEEAEDEGEDDGEFLTNQQAGGEGALLSGGVDEGWWWKGH